MAKSIVLICGITLLLYVSATGIEKYCENPEEQLRDSLLKVSLRLDIELKKLEIQKLKRK